MSALKGGLYTFKMVVGGEQTVYTETINEANRTNIHAAIRRAAAALTPGTDKNLIMITPNGVRFNCESFWQVQSSGKHYLLGS